MYNELARDQILQILTQAQSDLLAGRLLAISIATVRNDTQSSNASCVFQDNQFAGIILNGLHVRIIDDVNHVIRDIHERLSEAATTGQAPRPGLTLIKTDTKPNPPT